MQLFFVSSIDFQFFISYEHTSIFVTLLFWGNLHSGCVVDWFWCISKRTGKVLVCIISFAHTTTFQKWVSCVTSLLPPSPYCGLIYGSLYWAQLWSDFNSEDRNANAPKISDCTKRGITAAINLFYLAETSEVRLRLYEKNHITTKTRRRVDHWTTDLKMGPASFKKQEIRLLVGRNRLRKCDWGSYKKARSSSTTSCSLNRDCSPRFSSKIFMKLLSTFIRACACRVKRV